MVLQKEIIVCSAVIEQHANDMRQQPDTENFGGMETKS